MSNHTIIGIDLAKSVFQVAVMQDGKVVSNKRINRKTLIEFLANTPAATIAMEACYSSHYWARQCEESGHKALLIPVLAQLFGVSTDDLLGIDNKSTKRGPTANTT